MRGKYRTLKSPSFDQPNLQNELEICTPVYCITLCLYKIFLANAFVWRLILSIYAGFVGYLNTVTVIELFNNIDDVILCPE